MDVGEIGYHVWKVNIPEGRAEMLGFVKRDGYYDRFCISQMTKDYIKIYPRYS